MQNDICSAISDLVSTFNKYNKKYLIGGSLSSSLNGIFRSTNDLDILVDKPFAEYDNTLRELQHKFIIDHESLINSHRNFKAYNIFHQDTALKIDLFPAYTEFHQSQLARAIEVSPAKTCIFKIATAEDIVLAKLLWHQNSPSERQISDILGVLKVSKDIIDLNYLNDWAVRLKVSDKLNHLLKEVA